MVDKAWKKAERKIAKKLKGSRIPVSGISKNFKGDVLHDKFFVEVKYGKQIPKTVYEWYEKAKSNAGKKIPIVVMKPKGKHKEFVMILLDDFVKLI